LKKVPAANTIPNFYLNNTLGMNLYQAFDILSTNRTARHELVNKIMNEMKIVKQARLEYLTEKDRLKKTYIVR
jgi:hypothetical protein